MRRAFIEQSEADDARKRVDHRRLDALLAYCESVECRRRTLLAYFGEEIEPCGNCDLCLDPPTVIDGTELAGKVLETVRLTGERFGAAHVVDVLLGHDSEKIGKFGHERVATWGRGVEMKAPAWRAVIRQLVASGYLEIDIGGYGGLALTPRGERLLGGAESVRLNMDSLTRSRRTTRRERATVSAADAGPGTMALLQRLKDLRLALARERGVPPYVVFHDATLIALADRKPRTRAEFATIHGVGAAKLRDFADAFLAAIAEAEDAAVSR